MTEAAIERPWPSIDERAREEPSRAGERAPLLDPADVRSFVLAGNARVTVVSRASGARFTFRVNKPQEARKARTAAQEARDAGDSARASAHEARYRQAPWFVSVLTGDDNDTDYTWLAMVFPNERGEPARYVHPRKVRVGQNAPSARVSRWVWDRLLAGERGVADLLRQAEVWHEGRCGRCGRSLTVPESLRRGLGPVCAELMD